MTETLSFILLRAFSLSALTLLLCFYSLRAKTFSHTMEFFFLGCPQMFLKCSPAPLDIATCIFKSLPLPCPQSLYYRRRSGPWPVCGLQSFPSRCSVLREDRRYCPYLCSRLKPLHRNPVDRLLVSSRQTVLVKAVTMPRSKWREEARQT